MKVRIPTTAYIWEEISIFSSDGQEELGKKYTVVPSELQTVETPSFFSESKAGNGNQVCHVKMTNLDIVTESGQDVLSAGTYRATQAKLGQNEVAAYRVYYTDTSCYLMKLRCYDSGCTHWEFSVSWRGDQPRSGVWRPEGYVRVGKRIYADGRVLGDGVNASAYSLEQGQYLSAMLALVIPSEYLNKPAIRNSYSKEVSYLSELEQYLEKPATNRWTWNTNKVKAQHCTAKLPPAPPASYLILDEYNLLFQGASLVPYAAYHVKALRQGAYLDALDHVPQLNDNSLSNIAELVAFIKALVIDHRIEIPKSLSSAWLSYRYVYSTGKLDTMEAIRFVHRHVDKDLLRNGFSCYGQFTDTIQEIAVTCRCRIDLRQKELSYVESIWTALYRYGLSPSFYVIWDMIPYSFIVDWLIPVGDILSGLDTSRMYDREYDISNIWFSLKYQNGNFSAYTRWTEVSLPEFNGFYTLENKGTPSFKTMGYRILDAASLMFR
jgi:hypothetical protein